MTLTLAENAAPADASPASLTEHPDWAPVRGTLDVGSGWQVHTWEEPRLPGDIGQDTALVANLGPTLRLAAIDAAENKQHPDSAALALRATHTARGWLRTTANLDAALAGATRELCNPELSPRQRNPLAAVAVVDINRATGEATAVRCADCEVWVKRDDTWVEVFPGHMLTDTVRATYETTFATMEGHSVTEWWGVQELLLDDPDCWNTWCLGFAPTPRTERAHLGIIEEVIVTTDGARLTPERCANLSDWLNNGIQQFPLGEWPHPSPHGDLALLHLTQVQ